MVEDDWAAQSQVMPIVTELTVLTEETDADSPGIILLKRLFLLIGMQLKLMPVLIW
jgi:hypothetical protein